MSENTRPLRDFFQSLPTGTPSFLVGSDLTRVALSAVGGGIVVSISPGSGISVNSTNPQTPIVSLSPSAINSLALADTALQPEGVTVADIDATGTPGPTTFLSGDGSWKTVSGGGGGQVDSVEAGTGISVDDTDPVNPIVGLDSASMASLSLADTSVQPARNISTGTGLTGGGNLSADRTISLDSASIASLGLADSALQPSDIGVTVQAYDADTAKTDVGQLWTASQRPSVTALSVASGSIAWTLASGNDFSVTLTANATLALPSDIATHVGQKGRILISQDGTGGRTFSVNSSIIPLGSSTIPEIPSDPNAMAYFAYDVTSTTQIVFTLTGVGE